MIERRANMKAHMKELFGNILEILNLIVLAIICFGWLGMFLISAYVMFQR